jgi:hypothetical protein
MKQKKPSTKYQILRERWLRGRLGYKLHAGQQIIRKKISDSKSQLFVSECSRQFGKTYERVVASLEKALSKPKARIKIGTAFHTDLVEFILPSFDAAMNDCPEDLRPKFKVQGSKFVFHNGSEIKLVGLDRKPNGLRGNVIDMIILDEAGFIMNLDYLYKSVIVPATTHRPDCQISMISTPPSTPAHPFCDYAEKAEFEGGYCKLTIYDNPMVDEETIERLKKESGGENSTTWRREYLAERVLDSNLAIVPEWKDEYVQDLPRDDYYPFYHKYVAMDLGVSDYTAVIFGYYDFKKASLVIEDEYIINGPELTTDILQKDIKLKELELKWAENKPHNLKVPYLRVSDSNNPLLLQDLSYLHGVHFTATDKGSLEEMINTLRLMVSQGQIIVHPRCKHLKGCLKYGVWEPKRTKFARSRVYGHFDGLAALIYLVRSLNRSSNPIPATFQLDRSNQILLQSKQESLGTKELRKAFKF